MVKKPVNFRLRTEILIKLDSIVDHYSEKVGVKFDRTKAIEKLITDESCRISESRK